MSVNAFAGIENNLKLNHRVYLKLDNQEAVSGDDLYIDSSDKDLVFRSYVSGLETRIDNDVAIRSEYKSTQAILDLVVEALEYDNYKTLIHCKTIEGSTQVSFCNVHMLQSLAIN